MAMVMVMLMAMVMVTGSQACHCVCRRILISAWLDKLSAGGTMPAKWFMERVSGSKPTGFEASKTE